MIKRIISIAAILVTVAAVSLPFMSDANSTHAAAQQLGCTRIGPFPCH